MATLQPYTDYPGGKSQTGTYQQIINFIPPHRVRYILFAGNCGIHHNIREAEFHIINDLNPQVIADWEATGLGVRGDYKFSSIDARNFLRYDIYDKEYTRQHRHSFVYLDPPYLYSTRKGQLPIYKFELGETQQHIELLQACIALPPEIKVMISHYPCDLYDEMLKGWNKHTFTAKTRRSVVTEAIYYNYDLDGHLHDYSYIGQNFRVREKNKRITNNFFAKLDRLEPYLRNKILQEYKLQYRIKNR